MRLLLILFLCCVASVGWARDFQSWLGDLRTEARQKGVSDKTLKLALSDIKVLDQVIRLDRKQPENTIDFAAYRARILSRERISKGRTRMWQHRKILEEISKKYGVQPRFIVALWGIETNFGANTGGFDVVEALATLAYDGRRASFFRTELIEALRILDQGHISHREMQGSWAGAMGQSQFMPSSFARFAVDYNGDGRRDIWTTEADVFASAANYLAQNGWRGDETWGREVRLPPRFNRTLVDYKKVKKHMSEWRRMGVTKADGSPLPRADIFGSLVQPGGPKGPTYIIYDNYRALLNWNRSLYFATSVGLLADAISG